MKEFLHFGFTIGGIHAPWFSWFAAVVLIFWPAWEMFRLHKLVIKQKKICLDLTVKIKEMHEQFPFRRAHGVNHKAIANLYELFKDIPFLIAKWPVFRSKLIYRPMPDEEGVDQVWISESTLNIFTEIDLIGHAFNHKHFKAIPTICTGFGLLMTFSALLVGLMDVKVTGGKVVGLESLIGSLSGKFVSSISALGGATIFTFLEKEEFHHLNEARWNLTAAIDLLVPIRPESFLLDRISQELAAQTKAINSFIETQESASIGPTLVQMTTAIENMNQAGGSETADLGPALAQMAAAIESMSKAQSSDTADIGPAMTRMADAIEAMSQAKGSDTADIGPALAQMATAIENMSQTKGSSTEGVLEAILEMNTLLKGMAGQGSGGASSDKMEQLLATLSESLEKSNQEIGKTMAATSDDQFKRLTDVVESKAPFLDNIEQQLSSTQAALHNLVLFSEQLIESQSKAGSALSTVITLGGLAGMVVTAGGNMLGLGSFPAFGHIQTVGFTVSTLLLMSGLILHPRFRKITSTKGASIGLILFGAFFIVLTFVAPMFLGIKTSSGFGIIKFTGLFVGVGIASYGGWNIFRAGKLQKKELPASKAA